MQTIYKSLNKAMENNKELDLALSCGMWHAWKDKDILIRKQIHIQEHLYELGEIKLMIKHNIDVLTCSCRRILTCHRIFKNLETKLSSLDQLYEFKSAVSTSDNLKKLSLC